MYMCYSMLDRAHTHTPHSLPILILRAEVSYETAGMIPVHFQFNYPVHFIQFCSMFSVFWKCF